MGFEGPTLPAKGQYSIPVSSSGVYKCEVFVHSERGVVNRRLPLIEMNQACSDGSHALLRRNVCVNLLH